MECFKIQIDDLNGILSPLFFITKPRNIKGFVELNKIANINPIRKINNIGFDDLVPYVGLPETDEFEIKQVLKRPYKEVIGRNIIRKGDILFARIEPSIFNKKYIFAGDLKNNDYIFTSTEFFIVEVKENVNAKFVFYMFFHKDVFSQTKGRTTGSTGRRRLDKGVFKNLLIPFPDKSIQNKIVQLMDKSYAKKKQKEAQAQSILDSIDGFVLEELGIKLPKLEDKMCFPVNSGDVKNSRLDPYYYKLEFQEYDKEFSKTIYEIKYIKDFSKVICGPFGSSIKVEDYQSTGVPLIRIANIDENQKLSKNNQVCINKELANKLTSYKVKEGDLVISQRGTLGLIASIPIFFENAIISANFIAIKNLRNISSEYLKIFLSSKYGMTQLERKTSGQIQKKITTDDVKLIKVPIPPIEIQNRIANEVKKRTDKAKKLKAESEEIVNKAKQKVEEMILGK